MRRNFRQLWKNFLDALDLDRHLVGQLDQAIRVQLVIRAKSGNAARHSRTGDATEEEKVEDGGVAGHPVILLPLHHVDGDLLCRSAGQHTTSSLGLASSR